MNDYINVWIVTKLNYVLLCKVILTKLDGVELGLMNSSKELVL